MNRFCSIVLLAGGLAACTPQQRTEPPAPIVSARAPATETAREKSAPPSSAKETVEVYAYQPPSTAPDAIAPSGAIPAERPGPVDAGPISESATPGPAGTAPYDSKSKVPVSVATGDTAPAPGPEVVAYVPQPPSSPSLPPAADALLKQAEQQRQARDYVGAAATLERALGIQPREPYVWNRLARVRMEQRLYTQAGNLASRSNALAGDQVALKKDNWSMIAAARRASGDTAGAQEAERKARGG